MKDLTKERKRKEVEKENGFEIGVDLTSSNKHRQIVNTDDLLYHLTLNQHLFKIKDQLSENLIEQG